MDKTLKIAILLTAVDHMSEKVNQAVEKSQRKLKAISGLNAFGSLSITAGAMGLEFFEKAAQAAEESEIASGRVSQVFRSMGEDYVSATKHAEEYASKLQSQIAVEDEVIMGVQAKLATFSKAANEQARTNGIFDRATKAAFDLQAVGFGEASNNIVQLGKALQDPIKGMNALSRSGITFDEQERKKIKALVQSGRLFAAQNVLMRAVERQGNNTAAKIATPAQKMRIAWGEVQEKIGASVLPMLVRLTNYITKVIIPKVQSFIDKNPELVRWLGIAAASLLALGVAAKVVAFVMGGLGPVLKVVGIGLKFIGQSLLFLGRALLANPILLAIAAIAVGVFLIIKNWKSIGAWFGRVLDSVKNAFLVAWEWIKNMFLNYTPQGLVIKHWSKIASFFSGLWDRVKDVFVGFFKWYAGLYVSFYNAGKNIILSIWNGMKTLINKPVEAIKNMVGKIRRFLPFSPAKEGALRDIHKIKLVETIAASINSKPLISAMSGVMNDVANYGKAPAVSSLKTYSGGSVVVHYSPTIQGGASGVDLRKHSKEIAAMVSEEIRKKEMRKF